MVWIYAGLLGNLLFQSLIERGYGWAWVLEIIPAFALYRGLYEFSQYAFKANFGSGGGLTFGALNDGYNGMSVAMGIMVRCCPWIPTLQSPMMSTNELHFCLCFRKRSRQKQSDGCSKEWY